MTKKAKHLELLLGAACAGLIASTIEDGEKAIAGTLRKRKTVKKKKAKKR